MIVMVMRSTINMIFSYFLVLESNILTAQNILIAEPLIAPKNRNCNAEIKELKSNIFTVFSLFV
jgi:hypothetical protein